MVILAIPENAKIVDVRTPEECSSGLYPGAVNIPLQMIPSRIAELGDKKKPIVVYCVSGARSSLATKILRNVGFVNVHDGGGLSQMPKK